MFIYILLAFLLCSPCYSVPSLSKDINRFDGLDEVSNGIYLDTLLLDNYPTFMPSTSTLSSVPIAIPSTSPSNRPTHAATTSNPSDAPVSLPTAIPSASPFTSPTFSPTTSNPSVTPTVVTTAQPSSGPTTSNPILVPSTIPSTQPVSIPTCSPTRSPTLIPTTIPSAPPFTSPSFPPTTSNPSMIPTSTDSTPPTSNPTTSNPTVIPSNIPSSQPVSIPTCSPTRIPTSIPTAIPSAPPFTSPTFPPTTSNPSEAPTVIITAQPSSKPTSSLTEIPTTATSQQPTCSPTCSPTTSNPSSISTTSNPSVAPTVITTVQPSSKPTSSLTEIPTTATSQQPTCSPTCSPTTSNPSVAPTVTTTVQPTSNPTSSLTEIPTTATSQQPTCSPTCSPTTNDPTITPTFVTTALPTVNPTYLPTTSDPSMIPTSASSVQPTISPTSLPTTNDPTVIPTTCPSAQPSSHPSFSPITSHPSATPTTSPSAQPSSHPTSSPTTSKPSSIPTTSPSAQPSSHPTCSPSTSSPTLIPTTSPTSQPSSRPTYRPSTVGPSSFPTGTPSSSPSNVPSSYPSSLPSSIPSGQPTKQPYAHPTTSPSIWPSSQPSAIPSNNPSSMPTSMPSDFPDSPPSTQPSSHPTSRPSFQPSNIPTSIPSSQPNSHPTNCPSSMPSSLPSSQPDSYPTHTPFTSLPSSFPTGRPSSFPTRIPSTFPSSQPTNHPSADPSSQPIALPTALPSNMPSSQPTSIPSYQPTNIPSSIPTCQPNSHPTTQPSSQPTAIPSSQPFLHPTSSPSSWPTQSADIRILSCGQCQSVSSDLTCSFFTENVFIKCRGNLGKCVFSYNSIVVSPNVRMAVSGDCEIYMQSVNRFTLGLNSTILASAVWIAGGDVSIQGTINTSGRGSLAGPGLPISSSITKGWGGSYGGSGGRSFCDNAFTNVASQIGSVLVAPDLFINSTNNPTFGSAGEGIGAGKGGGRVVVNTTSHVNITGTIECNGGAATSVNAGAGSGGSIYIKCSSLTLSGKLYAIGGVGNITRSSAGGGGRIAINVFIFHEIFLQQFFSSISIHGGLNDLTSTNYDGNCSPGGSGTAFLTIDATLGILYMNNAYIYSQALTLIQSVPTYWMGFVAFGRAMVSLSALINFPIQSSSCYTIPTYPTSQCSFVDISYSSVHINNILDVDINTITASVINIHPFTSITASSSTSGTLNFTCDSFSSAAASTISFPNRLNVDCGFVRILGNLTQSTFNNMNGGIKILASINSTIYGDLISQSIFIQSVQISLAQTASLIITNSIDSSLLLNTLAEDTLITNGCWYERNTSVTCHNGIYSGAFLYSNSIVLSSSSSISVHSNLTAPVIVLCSPRVYVYENSTLSSIGMGCPMNHGPGAGSIQGGGNGGGANGGNGGKSLLGAAGGIANGQPAILSSGSGGGCVTLNGTSTSYSSGGGIVAVRSTNHFQLEGNILADGNAGVDSCGAGAGGSVYINAGTMIGAGKISAGGGIPLQSTGGAGGGGVVFLGNYQGSFEGINYKFLGPISSYGGLYGTGSTNAGSNGIITYPTCPPGYGSTSQKQSRDSFCVECPPGFYSSDDSLSPCLTCENAPSTAYYTESGWTNSECPYDCITGYFSHECLTPFQNVINTKLGGFFAFSGMLVGGLALLIAPLVYYRMQKKYGWHDSSDKLIFGLRISSVPWIVRKENGWMVIRWVHRTRPKKSTPQAQDASIDIESSAAMDKKTKLLMKSQEQRKNAKTFKDIRAAYRLSDYDASVHACRVYFLGSNHPFQAYGGPWILPESRPVCLRPMLWRHEYKEFASEINALAAWNWYDIFLRYLVALPLPPLTAYIENYLRYKRAERIMDYVASYDHRFFKNSFQRQEQSSIRFGISPDLTIAYLDFLYASDAYDRACRPLCPIGQVKLPAIFKIAGHGTYFTPWYVDSNDLLLQAISETELTSTFVDEAWIAFVVELNAILKTVYISNIQAGLIRLMKFFIDQRIFASLGGLYVELCVLPNYVFDYPSDRIKEELVKKQAQLNQDTAKLPSYDTHDRESTGERLSKGRMLNYSMFASNPSIIDNSNFWKAPTVVSSAVAVATGGLLQINNNQERGSDLDGNWLDQIAGALQHANPLDKLSNRIKADQTHSRRFESGMSSIRDSNISTQTKDEELLDEDQDGLKLRQSTATATSQNFKETNPMQSSASIEHNTDNQNITSPRHIFNFFTKGDDLSTTIQTFEKLCEEILKGRYALGIRVTHAKVATNTLALEDDDYDSDDGSFNASRRIHNNHDGDVDEDGVYSDDEDYSPRIQTNTLYAVYDDDLSDTSENGPITPKTPSSNDGNISAEQLARRVYGERAKEMERFYNIAMAAENSMKNKPTSLVTVDNNNISSRQVSIDNDTDRLSAPDDSPSKADRRLSAKRLRLSQNNLTLAPVEKQNHTTEYVEFGLSTHRGSDIASPRPSENVVGLSHNDVMNPVHMDNNTTTSIVTRDSHVTWDDTRPSRMSFRRRASTNDSEANISSSILSSSTSSKPKLAITLPENENVSVEPWISPDFNQRFDMIPTPSSSRPVSKKPQSSSTQSNKPIKQRRLIDSDRLASSAHQINVYSCHFSEQDRNQIIVIPPTISSSSLSSNHTSIDEKSNPIISSTSSTASSTMNVLVPTIRRSLARQSATGAVTVNFYLGYSIHNIINYRFYDAIYSSLSCNIMVGSNVYPIGTRGFRDILGLLLLVLCMIDVILVSTITTYYFCLGPDPTACTSHDALILMFALWPTAVITAPISGIIVILVGPDVMLTRSYASWLRLSLINTLIIVAFYIAYKEFFIRSYYIVFIISSLAASRTIQLLTVDLFIGHLERARFTTGWDGLATSLTVTQDNRIDIKY